MPSIFREFPVDHLSALLEAFPFQRKIESIHLHHTWRPNHAQYRGLASIEGMDRFHAQQGFGGLAQHLTLSPDGTLWTGRDWNRRPASAIGFNGNAQTGPFMIEMIGDFDAGKDPFDGLQKKAALRTVAALLRFFALPVTAIRFHQQMSSKTCPGTSIDYQTFCDEVGALMAESDASRRQPSTGKRAAPFADTERAGSVSSRAIADLIDSLRSPDAGARAVGVDGEPAHETASRDEVLALLGRDLPAASRGGSRDLTPDEIEELRPHVINLRQGRLSSGGAFGTSKAQLEAIFKEHLVAAFKAKPNGTPLRVVFWAHGGLVNEAKGLSIAQLQIKWWLANGVYPIHFVWESGLLETLLPFLGAGASRDFFDFTSDFLIEQAVRVPGSAAWGLMKLSAETASTADDGGGVLTAKLLSDFCKTHKEVELFACGHSAGSIFHNHFLPACEKAQVPKFKWVHYLAPAVRVANFMEKVHPQIGNYIEKLSIYTMREALEKDDNVAKVYRKSLLYMIRNALNFEFRSDILGLEECLLENESLKKTFGLVGNTSAVGDCVFSKTPSDSGRSASRSTTHGGFDNDRPTMHSILRRILRLNDSDPIKAEFPNEAARGLFDGLEVAPPPVPASPQITAPAFTTQARPAPASGTRIRALCVGIDAYPTAPLGGCVNDARLWASTFRDLGFREVRTLFDTAATHQRICAELKDLVASARPGDCVVFQYAGHGTQVPDLDGDEARSKDQAFVPIDYQSGKFLIDDEVRQIFSRKTPGVNITCFIDCCHSGSIVRMFGDGQPPLAPGERARFVEVTESEIDAYRSFRAANPVSRAQTGFHAILFAACQDHEVALESNGQGDFTKRAVPLLRSGFRRLSHEKFQQQVTSSFGATPRQNPRLDCDPVVKGDTLLLTTRDAADDSQPATGSSADMIATLQNGLRRMIDDLERLR